MSAIRSMALLAGMAFCSAPWAQEGFFIYSKKEASGGYGSETLIAQCSPLDKRKSNELKCVITKPQPAQFKANTGILQLPEVMTFIQISNPCWCKVDPYGGLICIPTGCLR